MNRALALCAVLFAVGCMAPPTPAQRVTEAARELNMAARFGRMDLAMGATNPGARERFVERRREWGGEIRVLDLELSGLQMPHHDRATLLVDLQWVRMSEGTLRNTRVEQTWSNEEEGGWRLVRERRVAGDVGLFGERVTVLHEAPRGDVHFPSRTIR
jgi:hypothetical protein